MKINQKYIADLLNVSRVTVTKALQDHPDIALSTRKKIKDLADELGYIPNVVGRSLSTKKTNTIGVIVPKINHSFFATIIEEIYLKSKSLGYQIILMVSFENEETELSNVKSLLAMNVDGIIMDSVSRSEKGNTFDLIKKHNKPIIFIDRKPRSIESIGGTFFDDYNLSYKLTKALIERGYKDLMYLAGPQEINICFQRLKGFEKAVSDSNLELPKNRVIYAGLNKHSSYVAFKTFIEENNQLPEAVVCVNDSTAIGIYKACEQHNIKIPDDIAVTGFGNIKDSLLLQPSLSTVKLDLKMAGKVAVEKLVNIINEKPSQDDSLIGGEIVFRDSVKDKV